MYDQLITGLHQCKYICEQEIVSVYTIKERLLTKKLKLMKQMTLTEMFTKKKGSSKECDVIMGVNIRQPGPLW